MLLKLKTSLIFFNNMSLYGPVENHKLLECKVYIGLLTRFNPFNTS